MKMRPFHCGWRKIICEGLLNGNSILTAEKLDHVHDLPLKVIHVVRLINSFKASFAFKNCLF